MELITYGRASRESWGSPEYLGTALQPQAWLTFVLDYTGRGDRVTRRFVALLGVTSVAYRERERSRHRSANGLPGGCRPKTTFGVSGSGQLFRTPRWWTSEPDVQPGLEARTFDGHTQVLTYRPTRHG